MAKRMEPLFSLTAAEISEADAGICTAFFEHHGQAVAVGLHSRELLHAKVGLVLVIGGLAVRSA